LAPSLPHPPLVFSPLIGKIRGGKLWEISLALLPTPPKKKNKKKRRKSLLVI
jgi:protoporphyrinogen oxidase